MAAAKEVWSNNSITTLAGTISNTDTTAALAPGSGALFPSPTGGDWFMMTFYDQSTGIANEIVKVTNVTGDTITMVRAQEGTTGQNWTTGTKAAELITAGGLTNFTQVAQAQAQAGNYAVDSGAANAYVVALTPALAAYQVGMPIRVLISHSNTAASTLNAGPGSLPIINPDGSALGGGTLVAGGIYEFVPDGAGHLILTSSNSGLLSSTGIASTGDVKWRPDSSTQAGWIICNATTIGNATSSASQLASASAQALYVYLWSNFSNSQCPVTGGRGATALADFTASKAIQVLDLRGAIPAGLDTMGGSATTLWNNATVVSGNTTTPGSILGANAQTISVAQLPTHTPAGTISTITPSGTINIVDPGHRHNATNGQFTEFVGTSGSSSVSPGTNAGSDPQTASATTGLNSSNVTFSGNPTTPTFTGTPIGSGSAINNTQRAMLGTWYQKL